MKFFFYAGQLKSATISTALIFILICNCFDVYAQFGGGTGTESDPYLIYTKSHIDSMANQDTNGKFYVLMNDITDTITNKICSNLAGSFNGKGHCLTIRSEESLFTMILITGKLDSLSVRGNFNSLAPFCTLNQGRINFCTNNLNDSSTCNVGICRTNSANGVISNCINNYNIKGDYTDISGICFISAGVIQNCTNNGNITIEASNGNFAGISAQGNGIIANCVNNGIINQVGMGESVHIGGITRMSTNTTIQNCINNGDISCKNAHCVGGISGDIAHIKIINCANYGNITGTAINAGGIAAWTDNDSIVNCFNSGFVTTSSGNESTGSGITNIQDESLTIQDCLNISRCSEDGLVGSNENSIAVTNSIIQNNYYDKQMCLEKGFSRIENSEFIFYDSINAAEGKLTTQLTGTSPELQAMLGDGWSYAEGRYPIPLGLENDSMALVAATPVYLHFETEEAYNHVDSVSKNFTVGIENNVSWGETDGRVSFSDENVTLLSIGTEKLSVNLGEYGKEVRINIVDTEVLSPQQNTGNGISFYPNPAGDYIILNLNGVNADKIEIYDITGKLLFTQNTTGENTEVFTGSLIPGIYMIKIIYNSQCVSALRLVRR